MPQYARCAVCRRRIQLLRDGTVRAHGPIEDRCPGGSQPGLVEGETTPVMMPLEEFVVRLETSALARLILDSVPPLSGLNVDDYAVTFADGESPSTVRVRFTRMGEQLPAGGLRPGAAPTDEDELSEEWRRRELGLHATTGD
jgi:hypothetical protein